MKCEYTHGTFGPCENEAEYKCDHCCQNVCSSHMYKSGYNEYVYCDDCKWTGDTCQLCGHKS